MGHEIASTTRTAAARSPKHHADGSCGPNVRSLLKLGLAAVALGAVFGRAAIRTGYARGAPMPDTGLRPPIPQPHRSSWAGRFRGQEAEQGRARADAQPADRRTLVILYGQPRGGIHAWNSLQTHVLGPLNADLATYFDASCAPTPLDRLARYRWTTPAYDDWSPILDAAAAACPQGDRRYSWRALFEVKDQFLGGIHGSGHPGSGGIMLAFRWLVQQKVVALNLAAKYDVMVLSRADQLHVCDHPSLADMAADPIHVLHGEEYGGWSDRHTYGSSQAFMHAMNITTELVCDTNRWVQKFKDLNIIDVNPEKVQRVLWQATGLNVTQVPRTMFTVKAAEDTSSWTQGQVDDLTKPYNLTVKYPAEVDVLVSQCGRQLIAAEMRRMANTLA